MTLDEALELANRVASESAHRISVDDAKRLARFVLDTLGAQMPCGWEGPRVDRGVSPPLVLWNMDGSDGDLNATAMTPDEALGIGARLIRAALAAKGGR